MWYVKERNGRGHMVGRVVETPQHGQIFLLVWKKEEEKGVNSKNEILSDSECALDSLKEVDDVFEDVLTKEIRLLSGS